MSLINTKVKTDHSAKIIFVQTLNNYGFRFFLLIIFQNHLRLFSLIWFTIVAKPMLLLTYDAFMFYLNNNYPKNYL